MSPVIRDVNRTRRSTFALAGTVTVALFGGCVSTPSMGEETEKPAETATPTATATAHPSACPLNHSIFEDPSGSITAKYEYEELSSAAKAAFEGALAADGEAYRVEATPANRPPEFHYSDVVDYYEITYEGEVYVLGTWGGTPFC